MGYIRGADLFPERLPCPAPPSSVPFPLAAAASLRPSHPFPPLPMPSHAFPQPLPAPSPPSPLLPTSRLLWVVGVRLNVSTACSIHVRLCASASAAPRRAAPYTRRDHAEVAYASPHAAVNASRAALYLYASTDRLHPTQPCAVVDASLALRACSKRRPAKSSSSQQRLHRQSTEISSYIVTGVCEKNAQVLDELSRIMPPAPPSSMLGGMPGGSHALRRKTPISRASSQGFAASTLNFGVRGGSLTCNAIVRMGAFSQTPESSQG